MKATNIKWDTDGDMEFLAELPTEMKLPDGMTDEDEISDGYQIKLDFAMTVLI